jgi:hypothetical protein
MKKLIIFTCLFAALNATASTSPEVVKKVLKAFSETFMNATDFVWHEVRNFYEASFKQSECISRAIYDKEGKLSKNNPLLFTRKSSNKYFD